MGPVTMEEAHDLAYAEGLEERREHHIYKSRAGHAEAGVGQHLRVWYGEVAGRIRQHGRDGGVAAYKGEAGAQEGRHLPLGQQMEQQRAQAGKQQRHADGQAGKGGHEHRGPEHGEHVLHAEHEHSRRPQRPRVVNGLRANIFLIHGFSSLFKLVPQSPPDTRPCTL